MNNKITIGIPAYNAEKNIGPLLDQLNFYDEIEYEILVVDDGSTDRTRKIVSEIIKTYRNNAKECIIHYYRDKESNEIDLVMEDNGVLHPLEIKKTTNPATELVGTFKLLDKASLPRGNGAIVCLRETLSAIDRKNLIIPAWII